MPRALAALGCLLLAALLPPRAATAAVRIVATVPDLAAIAREVAGRDAAITSLSLASQDPHFVDAKPNLALALARADLLLAVGLQLEIGWLPTLQTGSRNARIQPGARGFLDCSQVVRLLEAPAGPIDRALGDIHPGGNPHYLLDPRNAVAAARAIASRLAEVDPPQATAYLARAEEFARREAAARAGWEASLQALRGAKVVAYHKSFPYLAAWLGFQVIDHVEPRPGIPPTPGHMAHVLAAAREQGARFLLQEAYYPDTASRTIAERAGIPLVRLPGGTDFAAGQSWFERFDELVRRLRAGVGA